MIIFAQTQKRFRLVKIMKKAKFENFTAPNTIHSDLISRILYSTDASEYREIPQGVIYPASSNDVINIIQNTINKGISIIPRAAGTSLAGQVVGSGLVIDCSRYMNQILELNVNEKWVRIQPGVIRDELNLYLKPHKLFFSPETSTSNRCMLGGMVGNNACGAHSLLYGSTREHLLEATVVISDGSTIVMKALTLDEYKRKCELDTLEGKIYRTIHNTLSNTDNQQHIQNEYPHPKLTRRNTGYALDLLLASEPFTPGGPQLNLCKLLAGSEGTLGYITELKLSLTPFPPVNKAVVCAHFNSLTEALKANLIALKYNPGAIELIDDTILNCTKNNLEQNRNRFFVEGEPAAILVVEWDRGTPEELQNLAKEMQKEMQDANLGYAFPYIIGADINKVWALRKAGLGLLSNVEGDARPVSVVEDTAVLPEYLPDYINEFKEILHKYNLWSVYHAHAATGELHLRPVLNLREKADVEIFRKVALKTAQLVKKYKGSISGEHGDGRLRGEFIPILLGEHNYQLIREIKHTFDPNNCFNPGKIVDSPPMSSGFRFEPGKPLPHYKTYFDYSKTGGLIEQIAKCNGSGDCRKTEKMGGTMCPSYMASKNEYNTPRARANVMREVFSTTKGNPFVNEDIKQILDLCLSCKACKAECPSSVDIAKLKAEFLQHYYEKKGTPLRTRLVANFGNIYQLASIWPQAANVILSSAFMRVTGSVLGFSPMRKFPVLDKLTLKKWLKYELSKLNKQLPENAPLVYLFIDEFSNFSETGIGQKTVKLLVTLGYRVEILPNKPSGRAHFSKGMIRKAQQYAIQNVTLFSSMPDSAILVGIEPSAILSFRDEYPEIVPESLREKATKLARRTFLIDDFIAREFIAGRIDQKLFSTENQTIWLHGHCQQKALISTKSTLTMLQIPKNHIVKEINSGCCGMAGSFGFEKEHYKVSMQVGELVLFPTIRNLPDNVLIAAPGTSCRHQILDGTNRKAIHPIELLYNALIKPL